MFFCTQLFNGFRLLLALKWVVLIISRMICDPEKDFPTHYLFFSSVQIGGGGWGKNDIFQSWVPSFLPFLAWGPHKASEHCLIPGSSYISADRGGQKNVYKCYFVTCKLEVSNSDKFCKTALLSGADCLYGHPCFYLSQLVYEVVA